MNDERSLAVFGHQIWPKTPGHIEKATVYERISAYKSLTVKFLAR
jgi:hypothetical protein